MTEYTVIDVTDISTLSALVTSYCSMGWKCQGGVSTYRDESEYEMLHYIQSMVKK